MNCLRNSRVARVVLVVMFGLATPAIAQNWTMTSAPANEYWRSIASSADGSTLLAVSSNGIYASTNGGSNWTHAVAPATNWSGVASSADGVNLVAVVDGGLIYTSKNSGTTWTPTGGYAPWQGVASSGDGTRIVAVYGLQFSTGGISTSTNGGTTWTDRTPTNGYGWYSATCSADGIKLAAMMVDQLTPGGPYGWIYTSTNAGDTWTQATRIGGPCALASSSDGTKLVAAKGEFGPVSGSILISTNLGATWTTAGAPAEAWSSVASSADGIGLASTIGGLFTGPITGQIYLSGDSGATWTATDSPTNNWSSIASSADGCKLVAAVNGGGIYIRQTTPTPLLSSTLLDGTLIVAWTVPSLKFAVQQTQDLADSNWTNVAANPTLNSTTLQFQLALPTPKGSTFYRLVSP